MPALRMRGGRLRAATLRGDGSTHDQHGPVRIAQAVADRDTSTPTVTTRGPVTTTVAASSPVLTVTTSSTETSVSVP